MSELVSPPLTADVRIGSAGRNIALTMLMVSFVAVLLNLIQHALAYGQVSDDIAPF
jgi:hypothetical protein